MIKRSWMMACLVALPATTAGAASATDGAAAAVGVLDSVGSRSVARVENESEAAVLQGGSLEATPTRPGVTSLTLEEAVRLARENHPSLRRAKADVAAAEANVSGARAPLLPQVSANAGWQYQERPGVQFRGSQVSVQPHIFNTGVSVDQLVTDFGRTTHRLRAAAATEDARRYDLQDVEAAILSNVRQSFFIARARKALQEVSERTLENQLRHLELVAAFVELGERPPYDLAQARTNVGNARSDLAASAGAYRIARARLIQAMGIPAAEGPLDSHSIDVTDDTLPPVAGERETLAALLPEALASRPEIAALDQRIQAQQFIVQSNQAGYWPSLGVSAGASAIGTQVNELSSNWLVGANLSWPLFQGGATRAAVREAEAGIAALSADRDTLEQQVRFELDEALVGIETALAASEAAEETLDSAREQLRLAAGRYETGLGSLLELSDAEVALQRAEAALVQATYDLASARTLLVESLGRS